MCSGFEDHIAGVRRKMFDALPGSDWTPIGSEYGLPPERADVVIVGGGIIGWSIAFWLKQKEENRESLKVVVVEKDPTVRERCRKQLLIFLFFSDRGV